MALACSRHGSRVLDAIWSGAALGARKEIAAELGEYQPLSLMFPDFPSLTPDHWVAGKSTEIQQSLVPKGGLAHGFLAACFPLPSR